MKINLTKTLAIGLALGLAGGVVQGQDITTESRQIVQTQESEATLAGVLSKYAKDPNRRRAEQIGQPPWTILPPQTQKQKPPAGPPGWGPPGEPPLGSPPPAPPSGKKTMTMEEVEKLIQALMASMRTYVPVPVTRNPDEEQ